MKENVFMLTAMISPACKLVFTRYNDMTSLTKKTEISYTMSNIKKSIKKYTELEFKTLTKI